MSARRLATKPPRLFVSYCDTAKEIAGKLKLILEDCFGMQVLLAHEDIRPTAKWGGAILKELKTCDVFLPLLTRNFPESEWTDQETGMAVALNKTIIPLKIKIAPYGFIGKYQALRFKPNNLNLSCLRIAQTLIQERPEYEPVIKDAIIHAFARSESFDDAGMNSDFLVGLGGFNKTQINNIIRASIKNNQIYGSRWAKRNLSTLISEHEKKIDEKLLARYRKQIRQAWV